MAAFSSLGVGAGMDLNTVLSKLMTAERQPLVALEAKLASTNAKISTFGRLKSRLDALASASTKLSSPLNLNAVTATSSDTAVATASAAFNATPGTYAVQVTQLATAQKSFSTAYGNATVFGPGSLEFTVNGVVKTVNLTGQPSYTLQDIRAKITEANIGVSATVVSGSGGDRLVLTGTTTGSSGAFTLAAGAGSDASLVGLAALDNITVGLARSTAQDAAFSIDGIPATASSNTATTTVAGLTINLQQVGNTTLTVQTDSTKIKDAVQAFVDAFNGINSLVKENSAYDASTKKAQPLNGETTVRTLQTVLNSTRTATPSALASATFQSLSAIGVSVKQDGSLSLDASKLSSLISSNQADVVQTINAFGSAFAGAIADLQGTGGVIQSRIEGLNAQVKNYNDNKSILQVRIDGVEKRYRAQFVALDRMVSSLQATSSYLASQLTPR
ncbi:MAG: flagellar filament capping protein FliD [Candidatus Accumulibacter sp.]|uniref:flagellar filament capping protein FliD n=1 Tax=Accumulibacter sp. TaxID=2053492 RepID=UPI00287A958E|nr:flagellar filament capping protein FliD [Accumulibacter sp.]MDS4013411.1 flagellar filament capping protein FliD [Accumulibacter sp.]